MQAYMPYFAAGLVLAVQPAKALTDADDYMTASLLLLFTAVATMGIAVLTSGVALAFSKNPAEVSIINRVNTATFLTIVVFVASFLLAAFFTLVYAETAPAQGSFFSMGAEIITPKTGLIIGLALLFVTVVAFLIGVAFLWERTCPALREHQQWRACSTLFSCVPWVCAR